MLTSENLAYKFVDGPEIKFPTLNAQIGEKILITGSSGSGKSTFLNLIAGAIKLQTGKLIFDGFNYSAQKSYVIDKFRAEKIGYVFQTLNLIPFLSVFENITLSIKFSKKRAEKVNDVKDDVKRLLLSLGLEEKILEKKTSNLSIGQQQRVAVCRALLGGPKLFLADEPTSALDNESSRKFIKELFQTFDKKKQIIIMVSHDLRLADSFDRVINFNNV